MNQETKFNNNLTSPNDQFPAIKSFGLLFDEKENDVVDEEDSSSEEGDYVDDEDNKGPSADIQSIFSQLNLNELNPPVAKSSTMISSPYFLNDLAKQ